MDLPRKRPDLTPWTNGELAVDSIFANMAYFSKWGEHYIMRMKDNPATQRTVRCQNCGIVIPRDVPRLSREGSWYRKGHLCMECGKIEINDFMDKMKTLQNEVSEYLSLGNALLECADLIEKDHRYEDKLAMGKLCQLIGKNHRRY